MHSMTVKYRILAPALLAVATLLIGGFLGTRPTEGSDWENVNLQEVDVTMYIIQGVHTACLLATDIDGIAQATPAAPMQIECQDSTAGFPPTGKLLIYNYEGKDTHAINEELLQYDQTNVNCTLGPNGLCIIGRGVKEVFTDQGMLLATSIDDVTNPVTFDVQSTKPEGEMKNLVPGDQIKIDQEQFLVTNVEKDPPPYPLHTVTAVRAEKGTVMAAHAWPAKVLKKASLKSPHKGCTVAEEKLNPGCSSFVKWATQLTSQLAPDGMSFTVESSAGFIANDEEGTDTPTIGNEVITGSFGVPPTNTFTVTERGSDCGLSTGSPTTPAKHEVGDIVSVSDTFSITLGRIDHTKGTNALTRRTVSYGGCQVDNIPKIAFSAAHPFSKEQFPYDYAAPSAFPQSGTYDKAGQFTIGAAECVPIGDPPYLGFYVAQVVNLNSKDPFAQHEGSITIILDAEAPYDCTGAGGHGRVYFERLAGKEDTLEQPPLATAGDGIQDYLQYDSDGDRCPNYSELGTAATDGGARDPWNPWDYFEPTKNGQVRVNDIMEVVNHYGLNEGDPGYSTQYDRGGVVEGGGGWNQLPPNGSIRVGDILGVVGSYGHDCP